MKIQIADINNEIIVAKDFLNINNSLIAHLVCELELIKQEILLMYDVNDTSRESIWKHHTTSRP